MAQQNNQASQNDNRDNGDVGQLSFERAIEELESIVKRLEEGKVPLEELVAIYERGEALKAARIVAAGGRGCTILDAPATPPARAAGQLASPRDLHPPLMRG